MQTVALWYAWRVKDTPLKSKRHPVVQSFRCFTQQKMWCYLECIKVFAGLLPALIVQPGSPLLRHKLCTLQREKYTQWISWCIDRISYKLFAPQRVPLIGWTYSWIELSNCVHCREHYWSDDLCKVGGHITKAHNKGKLCKLGGHITKAHNKGT